MATVKISSAYTIFALHIVGCVVLLSMVIHLIYVYRQKKHNKSAGNGLKAFLITTIVGIFAFKIAIILEILVILQVILLDAHALHEDHSWIEHIYYEMFDEMEYFIAIFDTLGHLCVILVFIGRYQYTFRKGMVLKYNKVLVSTLYSILLVLFMCSLVIIILIIVHHKSHTIIISEIIWELAVEFMCLWILYLFTSKLYLLLKLSLTNHIKSGKSSDFFVELTQTIKNSINSSREKSDRSSSGSKNRTNRTQKTKSVDVTNRCESRAGSVLTMTIDGFPVDPVKLPQLVPTDSTNYSNSVRNIPKVPTINNNYSNSLIRNIRNSPNISEPNTPNVSQPNTPKLQPNNNGLHTINSAEVYEVDPMPMIHLNLNQTPKQSPDPSPKNTPKHTPEPANYADVEKPEEVLPEDKELEFQSQFKSEFQSQFKSQFREETVSHTATTKTNKTPTTHSSKSQRSRSKSKSSKVADHSNGAVDLIGVMNKLTLLVLLAVFTSTLSIIGNIFIEIHE